MNMNNLWMPILLAVVLPCLTPAIAADIFNTDADIPVTPQSPVSVNPACPSGVLPKPLTLANALERSLCNNPKTGESWAQIKAQAAAVGTAKGAYLPTLSLTGQEVDEHTRTDVANHPEFSSLNSSPHYSIDFSLNWVLYDFGARSAALDKAKALLIAAEANHMDTLQAVMIATAKDFYAAQAAGGGVVSALDTEQIARKSLDVVITREENGAASVGDELQARTALLQAGSERAKAQGIYQSDIGTLAIDMGLRPDVSIEIPDVENGVSPNSEFKHSVSALIDEAVHAHPGIIAAKAQLKAAEADLDQTKAEGMPSFSLVGRSSRDNQKTSEESGQPYFRSEHSDSYVGLQVSVPLFEGFTREYKVKEGIAQVEEKQNSLAETRNTVELDVWKSFQQLKANASGLPLTRSLLITARQSYEAASHRYENGVGNIIELLNAQKALADAEKQEIQSLTDWRYSRLELAERLGKMGLSDSDEQ